MLFNSYSFILAYLPVVFTVFFLLGKNSHRLAASWLGFASLFFYGWWSIYALPLLLSSILANYRFSIPLSSQTMSDKNKRIYLFVAVLSNLIVLGVFKYSNFFISTANDLISPNFGWGSIPLLNIVLPLGISFFTFTQIAFLVDTYRGQVKETDPIHYLLFVTYFPHLIAGPVLHHKQMMPQFGFASTYRFNHESVAIGLTVFCIGLFKKVVFADELAVYANLVFDGTNAGVKPTFFDAWTGALAYTLQLYFDFSGYSDMAIGLSRLFNIRLPLNFNSPYKAFNIIEFWRRWHMTLSAFLRDYIYIPLGGNRNGKVARYRNLILTMLLGGLWHGAGWTFVLWGGLHGIYLVINHAWLRVTDGGFGRYLPNPVAIVLGVGMTFLAVVIAWVSFRAANFATAIEMYRGMFGIYGIGLPNHFVPHWAGIPGGLGNVLPGEGGLIEKSGMANNLLIFWILVGMLVVWVMPNAQQWLARFHVAYERVPESYWPATLAWRPNLWFGILTAIVMVMVVLKLGSATYFIYFQF